MGPSPSNLARSRSSNRKTMSTIDKRIREDRRQANKRVKILVLGTGESGKSTLLKQVKLLHKRINPNGHQLMDSHTVQRIRVFVIYNLKELVRYFFAEEECVLESKSLLAREKELTELTKLKASTIIKNKGSVALLKEFWEDKGVQKAWKETRSQFQIQDSLSHFMGKFLKIFSNSYVPTEKDWLLLRVKSVGIVETHFTFQNVNYTIVDVGGQQNERPKWLHAFSEVDLVIWVTAINEYDQVLLEDSKKNRLRDSIEEFSKAINDKELNKSSVDYVIFLNKLDLYKQKLKRTNIVDTFPEFPGPNSVNAEDFNASFHAGIDFFEDLLFKAAGEASKKIIAVHTTCAMNQRSIKVVFSEITSLLTSRATRIRL